MKRRIIQRIIQLSLIILLPIVCLGQTKDELMGKIEVADNAEWTLVDNHYVLNEVYGAYNLMRADALSDGIKLNIVSGFRSYDRQKVIWRNKWKSPTLSRKSDKEKLLDILEYSSMPGTSRHHWGTDIDLNSVELKYFRKRKGRKVYHWLNSNAHKYGFFQPYTKGRTKGYKEEKWHWSYALLSNEYLDKYLKVVKNEDILKSIDYKSKLDIDIIEGWVKL